MAGISDKALKAEYAENKYRFNFGSELQNKEFSDGSGLEFYDAHHRMYDPQIGRFGQLDPLGDATPYYSPYSFASNNPITRVDPFGLKDSVYTTRTTNLPSVTVVGHAHAHWFYYPESTQYDRDKWTFHQHLYQDRLAYGQPLNQKGDPAGYTASKPMYDRWAQADKEGRAMQAWAVGIMAVPALLAVSPAEVGLALQMKAGWNVGAFAVDMGVQAVVNKIEHKDIASNYNFLSGGLALTVGAPEGATLSNVIGVNTVMATVGTSVNMSVNGVRTRDIFSFNPQSILIGTVFGSAAGRASQAVGGGPLMDAMMAPINFTGTAVDEGTKKDQ